MATPAQLVKAISEVTGTALPTMVDIDRKLVKGKLRTKEGRGFSAARMTAIDAARLLTALLGSAQANASAEAVKRYARTQPDKTRSSDKLFASAEIDDLAALPPRHSFIDALAALLASAGSGSLANLAAKAGAGWYPHIEVFAFTRATRGRIRIVGLPNGRTASIEYGPIISMSAAPKANRRKSGASDAPMGDLEQSRRITERTILAVAKLLSAGELP